MKQTFAILTLLMLLATSAGADVLYRETFDHDTGIPNPSVSSSWTTNPFNWYVYYCKNGKLLGYDNVTPLHREWFQTGNSTVDAVAPAPTANSLPVLPYPQPYSYLTGTDIYIWSREMITDTTYMSNPPAYGDFGGEFKPLFSNVDALQFDMNNSQPSASDDKFRALVYTGGHWYCSQDYVVDANEDGASWERYTINWKTTKWDQLRDGRVWRLNSDPTKDAHLAYDVSTSGFGTIDSFGLLNFETHCVWSVDNITLLGVPEPATMSLLALGAASLLRRRNG